MQTSYGSTSTGTTVHGQRGQVSLRRQRIKQRQKTASSHTVSHASSLLFLASSLLVLAVALSFFLDSSLRTCCSCSSPSVELKIETRQYKSFVPKRFQIGSRGICRKLLGNLAEGSKIGGTKMYRKAQHSDSLRTKERLPPNRPLFIQFAFTLCL